VNKIVLLFIAMAAVSAFAQHETVLYSFKGGTDGNGPSGGNLIFDNAGDLVGATSSGGTGSSCYYGCGTIFRVTRNKTGWVESVIYNFTGGTTDGSSPNGDLAIDARGTLYGTTSSGGAYGYGVVFELKRSALGYSETVLHDFASGTDGAWPYAGLVIDSRHNLYGTTSSGGGGTNDGGIVFELSPSGGGWIYSVLHVFGNGTDGATSYDRLTMDSAGNLFGTTAFGGSGASSCPFSYGCGTAFELTHGANNVWKEGVIYSFVGNIGALDAAQPRGSLAFDATGNLYGTSWDGGSCIEGCGTVFEISPSASGWTDKVLFSFLGSSTGLIPNAGVAIDGSGNLYGTTVFGGGKGRCLYGQENFYCGTLYKLSLTNGAWTESFPHIFVSRDGAEPWGGLILDKVGNLYGTTTFGGAYGFGIVYRLTP
jgi:uncharacterized repeat protein (TIGR03803 family)